MAHYVALCLVPMRGELRVALAMAWAAVLGRPHNFRPYSCFAFPSRLSRPLSPSRRLNTSRSAEDGRPYQNASRQRLAGGGGGASSSMLRVTLRKV